ncbi:alpha-ketoacid dehydrogenase subunit alpha/beta [Sanyastnella coralliicola]|uniref:alpha-ketoacid dehydrogenase subunit alpha/beta n=1 Tax=Sanyastnella coralliicola TaxID=3069118 RepID=UPI0027BA3B94|nr:alpha-ketoacid dehydrogenase subunit alpha/beta [Longitalea sp. SCSIO 12813]
MSKDTLTAPALTQEEIKEQVIADYRIACISREASLLGRKEVLTGKAKFGIFGDGKEVAQLAMARQFRKGDFRSGYYRDQTFMMALGELNVQEYFAALYAHPDVDAEPTSGGRQMGGHFATRSLDEHGNWKNLMEQYNSSADISPTAGQMPRLLGLAQASKIYRHNDALHGMTQFTEKGNEVAFGTIGDASTSEGLFWETMNAAAVLQVPMAMSVWDDGYGISVPKKYQTVKESISEALSGFAKAEGDEGNGIRIFRVKGWNYPELMATYEEAVAFCREQQIPVLIHVEEVTQPQGHSTSGSHERYKTKERLEWAEEFDCIRQFGNFIVESGLSTQDELDEIRKVAKKQVRQEQKAAWAAFRASVDGQVQEAVNLIGQVAESSSNKVFVQKLADDLGKVMDPIRKEMLEAIRKTLRLTRGEDTPARQQMIQWYDAVMATMNDRYSARLYSRSEQQVENIDIVPAEFGSDPEMVDGRIVLRKNFEKIFEMYPEVLTFGEDTGKIGGVNQAMEGMQEQFGELRVSDTGIREATILGQGIGMAMRGLRPIAEIQYLDYLYYALQIMRDDLATVQYRTYGGQKAPLIIRTRGHRLEGIWHSGSPMGAIIHSVRGINVCVPRNMTQAAGMYNTLLKADEPALVVECLNGYRSKEALPTNLGEFTVPLGTPEVVKEGSDLTIISYGSTFNLCEQAAKELAELGIDVELVDVQTLLPFDKDHVCAASIEKTNKVLFVDEDVPGGASAYMMDQVLNVQGAYFHLDSQPQTLAAKPHLPAYGTDGDYFSKPSVDDIVEAVYGMMSESDPASFPALR